MPLQNIKKKKLRDDVYQQMLDMIVSGEWKPGAKIPSENQLAEMLGVSRITVREVIQKLISLGMMKSRQGGGTYVCEIDGSQCINQIIPCMVLNQNSIRNILEFRLTIESGCAHFAAVRAQQADIEKMRDTIEQMKNPRLSAQQRAELDFAFHYAVASSTHNPLIIRVYDTLQDLWFESMQKIVATMGSQRAVKYHTAILQAICDNDSDLAGRLMNEHIENTIDEMNPVIDEENDLQQ